jgi:hypothetical protein
MTVVPMRSVSRGTAATLLALLPAYCSIDGLVTGDTLAIARHADSFTGTAGIVAAIAYGLFATALVLAAVRYFSANSKRRAALFKWAWNVTIVAAAFFFSASFVWIVQ